jgi:hypothetical protein
VIRRRTVERASQRAKRPPSGGARGVVFVEYMILVAFVGIIVTLGLVALGPTIMSEYSARRGTLYDHSP